MSAGWRNVGIAMLNNTIDRRRSRRPSGLCVGMMLSSAIWFVVVLYIFGRI